jgi:hypothetical protein
VASHKIFLTIFFSIACQIIYGQAIHITGAVKDSSTKLPIQDAIVTLKQSGNLIASKYTNAVGYFSFNVKLNKNEALQIECRHISYANAFQFKQYITDSMDLIILMQASNKELSPIEIKSKWEVKQQEDTLKYNPEAYKSSTTKTVSDLLSNIPGFKVLPDGQILFRNVSVSALLIDGDNVANEQYGILNKNLDARAVAEIEVFNNYEKNSVLRFARKSGKLAVNIKITDDFKGKVNGNLTAGLGIPDRAILNTSLVKINQKNKQFILGNGNNIAVNTKGDAFKISKIDHTSNTILSLEQDGSKLITEPTLRNEDLPDKFTINNQTLFLGTLGLVKFKKNKEITYRIGYEYDRQRNNKIGETAYFLDSLQHWFIKDSTGLEKRSHQMALHIQYRHNNSTKFAGEVSGVILLYNPTFRLGSIIGGDITDTTLQDRHQNKIFAQTGYNGVLKTKSIGIIQINSYASYQNNILNDRTITKRFNDAFKYNFTSPSLIQQDFGVEKKLLFISLSNLPKSGKRQIEFGIDILQNQYQYNQTLAFSPIPTNSNQKLFRFLPQIHNQFYGGFFHLKFLRSSIHKIDFKAKAGMENLNTNGQRSAIVNYNLSLRDELKIGKFLSIQTNASIKQSNPEMDWFGPDTVLQSVQNLVQSAKTISPVQNFTFHSGIFYRKLTGNNYSFDYSFNRIEGEYGWMPTLEPGFNLLQAAPIGLSKQHMLNSDIRRYFHSLKGTITLGGRYSHHNYDLFVNSAPVTNIIENYFGELKWTSSFPGKLNFEVIASCKQHGNYAIFIGR